MFQIISENIVPLLAGLFPSLMVLVPTFTMLFKNIKVNRNVEDLQNAVKDLLTGDFNISKVIDHAKETFKDLSENYLTEIMGLIEELKGGLVNDINALEERFQAMQKGLEANYISEMVRFDKMLKELRKNVDHVLALPEEGQKEVSDI